MKFYLTILFLMCFAITNAQENSGITVSPLQQQLSETDLPGKPQCFLFDATHLMYIGTSNGLYTYNGLKVLPVSLNTTQVNITSLYTDKNNQLWAGLQNGTIICVKNKQAWPFQPQEGLPKKEVSKIIGDYDNRLWFATQGEGVYVQHAGKLYNINTDDGLSDNYVYDLELLPGNIIAASTDKGLSLCSFNGTKKTIDNYSTGNGLPDNIVRCITPDRNDKSIIWLGFQQGGICRFSLITKQAEIFPVSQLKDKQVNDILVLDEQIWITTENSFLQLNKKGTLLSEQSFNNPSQLAVGTEANGWLISRNGLFKSDAEKIQTVLLLTAEETNEIHDVLEDAEGNTWYNLNKTVVKFNPATSSKQIFQLPGVDRKTDITCLYQDGQQNIWVGTMGKGIYLINSKTNTVKHLSNLQGNEGMSILSITGKHDHVWISSLQGIFKATAQGNDFVFQNLTELSGIGISYIYHIYEDSKGRVWFATDGKGLVMMQDNRFSYFGEKEGLTAKVIYSVAEDRKGIIWCAAFQKGLFQLRGNVFSNFGTSKGIPDLDISSLNIDNKGNLFCISRSGLFLVDAESQDVILPGNNRQTGMFNTDLNSTAQALNGVLFHTAKGIFKYCAPSYQTIYQPQTTINAVSLFLNEINAVEKKSFKHDENNLSFSFNGIYFSDPSRVQYQYRLDGYNNEWQVSKNDEINFPKLPSGTYTFRVRSSVTGNFDHAKEASYTFTIGKPFWKQWWFILLVIAAVTASLIYIIKEREKAAKRWQQLQTEKLQSQYETLKNQVNPHFLFNSFNTLLSIIEESPENAAEYVEHLSDFYRNIVNLREKDLVSLADETDVLGNYFFIQQKRFCTALEFEDRITPEEKAAYQIPPLSLQILAENALKHNIVSKEKPLKFELFTENGMLVIRNNINLKQTKEKGESFGLQNINNRFSLIASKEIKIENTGTHFIVKLPLIKRL